MATSTIGTLVVAISANSARFSNELRKTRRATTSWAQRTRAQVRGVTRVIGGVGVAFAGAAAAIVAANRESIDSLGKTADKLGVTTEALEGFRFAAEQTGVSSRTLDTALQRFTRRLADAAAGGGPAAAALERLGLSAQNLSQQSPDEALRRVADAFQGVENQAERVRIAFALFDSEGVGLVNTLAGGSAELDRLAAKFEELGGGLSRFDVSQVEAANDAFSEVGAAIRIAGQRLTVELAPFLTEAANLFTDLIRESGGFGNIVQKAFNTAAESVAVFLDVLDLVREGWVRIGQVTTGVLARLLRGVARVYEFLGREAPKALQENATAFELWSEDLRQSADRIRDSIDYTDVLEDFQEGVRRTRLEWEAVGDTIESKVNPAIQTGTELTKEQEAEAARLARGYAQRYSGLQQALRKDFVVNREAMTEFSDDQDTRIRQATQLTRGFGNALTGAFAEGEKSAQQWFNIVISLFDTLASNADTITSALGGIFGGGGGGGSAAGAAGGLLSGLAGLFGGGGGAGVAQFATGGVAAAGGGLLPFFQEGTPRVPRTGPAVVHEGEMIIDPDSAAALRRYGIPLAGGGGGVAVTIINNGPPMRVTSSSKLSDRELELVVETAADRVRGEFEDSLSTGYGRYTNAIERNLEAPRRHR